MLSEIDGQIKEELYQALELLGARSDLLQIIGSWSDTMPDEWVLETLRAWNDEASRISSPPNG